MGMGLFYTARYNNPPKWIDLHTTHDSHDDQVLPQATGVISGMPLVFLAELYKSNQAETNHSELPASGFLA